MPLKDDVTDSTDWLTTSLASFTPLDAALRCQVCKDFYDTPMITSCSHTFCSLCIRRCLSTDGKCPTCRASDQSSKLRRNWTVQEVVDAFAKARPEALDLARKAQQEQNEDESPKRKRRKVADPNSQEDGRARRNPARQTRSQASSAPLSQDHVVDSEEDVFEEFLPDLEPESPAPNDGLVACPMCNKRMKEELVFTHIDRCDGEKDDKRKITPPRQLARSMIDLTKSPAKQLPHLNYSLLKDTALKKKLQELGIPTWGNRQLLIRRHTQWVDIFNANSDSPRPRSTRELLKDLDTWERTQGGNAPGQGQSGPTGVMRKDFDGTEWTGRHKSQFDDLIVAAKARRGQPKTDGEEKKAEIEPTKDDAPIATTSNDRKPTEELGHILSFDYKDTIHAAQPMLSSTAQEICMRDASHPSSQLSHTETEPGLNDWSRGCGNGTSGAGPATFHRSDSLPGKLASPNGARKIPMFQVPEDPIHDVEGIGGGAMSGGG